MDRKDASIPRLALHGDPSAVRPDDVIDDRQAETASLDVVDEPGRDAMETLEDFTLLVALDPDPAVGDILAALNGIRFGKENEEMLMRVREKQMKPGSEVTYTVARAGYERQIPVTLATAPPDVLASWIGHHMLEHVSKDVAKK